MPAQAAKRTTVNVTILNEKGEKVFSDVLEDVKLIERERPARAAVCRSSGLKRMELRGVP